MTPLSFLLIAVGIVFLVAGAEIFIRGAVKLAALIGVSPLVIGLTVVAYGTSMPELAVNIQATSAGLDGLAVGNAVGSNIANILLILGLSALVAPLVVSQQLVRLDVPLMLGASVLVIFMASDGNITAVEGGMLFGLLIAYTVFLVYQSRRENQAINKEYEEALAEKPAATPANLALIAGQIVVGVGGLVLGSTWLVEGARSIAEALGVSDLVIGLTVVAIGTSLPELATSMVASYRGERDIAVGNVVGSNMFNLLMVIGLGAIFAPDGLSVEAGALRLDMPVMLAASIICLPIFFTGQIPRWAGGMFFGYYVTYTLYLVYTSTGNPAADWIATAVLYIAAPLTVAWLAYITYNSWRERQKEPYRRM